MNILIDINHPAHVHLYRHFIREMESLGHRFWLTVKNVAASKDLLRIYGIPFIEIGDKSDSLIGKAFNQLKYNARLRRLVSKNGIDTGIGTSITIAHVSRITRMNSIVFDDDDDRVEPLFTLFVHPFVDCLVSPDALRGARRRKSTLFVPAYHELAYLHPKRFTPDPCVLQEARVKPGEPFFVLRFNAFKAHHDIGIAGLSLAHKQRLVRELQRQGKVFITMERELDPEFQPYRLRISPDKIHSLLYYACLFIGDSQTMTTEAAILGTPALKCNSFASRLAVPNELQDKYGLCFSYLPADAERLFAKLDELLSMPDLKGLWRDRRDRMLRDKIDLTAFMVWFAEEFPRSVQLLKQDPEYPMRFK